MLMWPGPEAPSLCSNLVPGSLPYSPNLKKKNVLLGYVFGVGCLSHSTHGGQRTLKFVLSTFVWALGTDVELSSVCGKYLYSQNHLTGCVPTSKEVRNPNFYLESNSNIKNFSIKSLLAQQNTEATCDFRTVSCC